MEAERREQAEPGHRTRELRYRDAVDQRWLRLGVGTKVFLLSAGGLAADVTLTLATGWGELGGRPSKLDGVVLAAFLTTSTATVIGLFLVLPRWLYPPGPVAGSSGRDGSPDLRSQHPAFYQSFYQ